MNWKDNIDHVKFSITTGDGKNYLPLWVNGQKAKEYNTTTYNFIDQEGSFVARKKPKSNKHTLLFYFQGEDNIAQADAFEKSANDPRSWQVNHPLYGGIIGQPTSLTRNDEKYNATQVTVEFWETGTIDFPKSDISVTDRVAAKTASTLQAAQVSYLTGATPATADIAPIKDTINQQQANFNNLQDNTTKVASQNAFATALKATDRLLSNTKAALTAIQDLISLSATYAKAVTSRIKAFKAAYENLKAIITNLNGKYYFECMAATTIANTCEAAANPTTADYTTREEIQAATDTIVALYADYLQLLDANQVSQYDIENAWVPNAQLQRELYELVTETVANLYQLAFNAKQERIVYTDKDTNLFLLTHRYLGLDAEDMNLENFRKRNNIKNSELFVIRKGRKIKYVV